MLVYARTILNVVAVVILFQVWLLMYVSNDEQTLHVANMIRE